MRNSYQIYCDYVRAISKASQLDRIARTLHGTKNRYVLEQVEELACSWQGDPIYILREKGDQIALCINDRANELQRLAETIRTIAVRNYNAEMRALELARNRESGGGFR
ncbi:MAG: hypothetical protein IJA62_03920 [Ruminococcus sp.]|nr:hypothetical protein [Ruminococcus sp.]